MLNPEAFWPVGSRWDLITWVSFSSGRLIGTLQDGCLFGPLECLMVSHWSGQHSEKNCFPQESAWSSCLMAMPHGDWSRGAKNHLKGTLPNSIRGVIAPSECQPEAQQVRNFREGSGQFFITQRILQSPPGQDCSCCGRDSHGPFLRIQQVAKLLWVLQLFPNGRFGNVWWYFWLSRQEEMPMASVGRGQGCS